MGLYLGFLLGEMQIHRYDYFGGACDNIYNTWGFFELDEGYIIAAVVTGVIVSFCHTFYHVYIYRYKVCVS